MTKAKGFNPPQPTLAENAYKEVKTDMVLDKLAEFDEVNSPARTFYEEYIISGGSSTDKVANIGDYNKTKIANDNLVSKPDQPVKNHLIICSHQYDSMSGGVYRYAKGKIIIKNSVSANTIVKLELDNPVFDPALHGIGMVNQIYWFRNANPTVRNNISFNNVAIPRPRKNNHEISVKLPVITPAPTALDPVTISIVCFSPYGPYLGESFGKHSLIVFDPADVGDYNDTIAHEIGHAFNQTPRPGKQPDPLHIPDHPSQADRGQGNHCQVVDKLTNDPICVMYDSGPLVNSKHKFCETCQPYLLAEDLYKL